MKRAKWEINELLLGNTAQGCEVPLLSDDRETAIHIVGISRRGKTKQVELLERQKIENGEGGVVIDPHGGLYQGIERWLAANPFLARRRKIRLIDPAAPDMRFGINPLHVTDRAHIADRVFAVMGAFSKMWGSENIERMPTYQRCFVGIAYAIAAKGLTLVEFPEIIPAGRKELRRFLASDLPDSIFSIVWEDFEVLQRSHRDWRSEFTSTFNRIIRFLTSPIIKETVGQTANVIDWRQCMDEGEYLVVNLQPRPGFSADHARMLGRLIVHELFDVALKRPADVSRPFFLTIDECADYLSDDIPRILPQTAKFGLHVTLIHQYLGQLKQESEFIYHGVMNQAPTKIAFGISYADALELAPYLLASEYNFERPKKALNKETVVGYQIVQLSSASQSEAEMTGGSDSSGQSTALSTSSGTVLGTSYGAADTVSEQFNNEGEHMANGHARQTSEGSVESFTTSSTESSAENFGHSSTWALTKAQSFGVHQAAMPILQLRPTATYSKEEIAHLHAEELMNQEKRHAMVRHVDPARPTERYLVPEVEEGTTKQRRIDELHQGLSERNQPTSIEGARAELADRYAKMIAPYLETLTHEPIKKPASEEPTNWRE